MAQAAPWSLAKRLLGQPARQHLMELDLPRHLVAPLLRVSPRPRLDLPRQSVDPRLRVIRRDVAPPAHVAEGQHGHMCQPRDLPYTASSRKGAFESSRVLWCVGLWCEAPRPTQWYHHKAWQLSWNWVVDGTISIRNTTV